jgi:hypothetical protein
MLTGTALPALLDLSSTMERPMVIEPSEIAAPPPPPRPRWHPLFRCLLFLVAFLVAQVLAVFLLELGFRLTGIWSWSSS